MFGSQVLEVGVGLAMLFAFMSLIATALNEAIESVLRVRAQQLEQGIRNILDDPNGTQITEKFFNNPLISILYSGEYKASALTAAGQVTPPPTAQVPAPASVANPSARARTMPWSVRSGLPSYIPSANFALAVLTVAAKDLPPLKADDIRNNIETTLKDCPQLKGIILQGLATGKDDLQAVQKFIENWYDSAMDRVSGWYKTWAQTVLFCIGLFAAVVLNVDTITVARSLIDTPSLRQAVLDQAAKHPNTTDADFKSSLDALNKVGYPIGWTNLPQLQLKEDDSCSPKACIERLFTPRATVALQTIPFMVLGWLITALAITLGAPFWFDLLDKFMQVRSTSKPQPPDAAAAPAAAVAAAAPARP